MGSFHRCMCRAVYMHIPYSPHAFSILVCACDFPVSWGAYKLFCKFKTENWKKNSTSKSWIWTTDFSHGNWRARPLDHCSAPKAIKKSQTDKLKQDLKVSQACNAFSACIPIFVISLNQLVFGKLMQLDRPLGKFRSNFANCVNFAAFFETIRHRCFESSKIQKSFIIIDYIKILTASFDLIGFFFN